MGRFTDARQTHRARAESVYNCARIPNAMWEDIILLPSVSAFLTITRRN